MENCPLAGHGDPKLQLRENRYDKSGVRVAETLQIFLLGKKAWGRKRGAECTGNHIKY